MSAPQTHSPAVSHLASIDALRGWAFLGVVSVHVALNYPPFPGRAFALNGAFGVQLFFVVSAYTLARSWDIRHGRDAAPVKAFFVRRVCRLAPLYWFAIALFLWTRGTGPRDWAPEGIGPVEVLLNVLMLHSWWPTAFNSVVEGGWSIGDEFMFYLCFPLLIILARTLPRALWLGLAAVVFGRVASELIEMAATALTADSIHPLLAPYSFYSFPSQLPVFTLGLLAYRLGLNPRWQTWMRTARHRNMLAAAVAIAFALSVLMPTGPFPKQSYLGAVFALGVLILQARPVSLLVNRVTVFLGQISYSGYVFHFWVIAQLGKLHLLPAAADCGGPLPAFTLALALVLAGTIPLATASYHLIEKPGIHLGRRWLRSAGYGETRITRHPPFSCP